MSKKQKAQTLSIIIPVYNEEDYLGACLQSIAEQTVKPLEVIVVDNNSTDRTALIARSFDFVRLVREKRQHQSYAQHTGFSLAKGSIIGRIDADTILPPDWTERCLAAFKDNPDIVGFYGSALSYDIVLKRFGRFIHGLYFAMAGTFAGTQLMWGSNSAFRARAWQDIRHKLTLQDDIWEDYDLGFCLSSCGEVAKMDNDVSVSYRSIHCSLLKQLRYQLRSIRTFRLHRGRIVSWTFGAAWFTMVLLGPVVLVDYFVLKPLSGLRPLKVLFAR